MTTATLKQNAIQIARCHDSSRTACCTDWSHPADHSLHYMPVLQGNCQNNGICSELKRQLAKINRLHPENHARGTASLKRRWMHQRSKIVCPETGGNSSVRGKHSLNDQIGIRL